MSLCRKAIHYLDQPFTIWGDGNQTRCFLYIDDCVDATLKLMESDISEPLNIGSDRLVTIEELADLIIFISGKPIEKEHDLSRPQGVRGRNASLTLTRNLLGWEPKVSLEEGLEKSYRWLEGILNSLVAGVSE